MKAGRIGMALAGAGALLAVALTVRSTTRVLPVEKVELTATLKDMDGHDVPLSQYAGRPVVINLWATWCGPCRLEMPQLVDLYSRLKDRGLVMLGISIDDTPDKMRAFAQEYSVNYPLLVGADHPGLLEALGYTGPIPMTLFIRPDGTLADRTLGIETTASMERRMLALLEGS